MGTPGGITVADVAWESGNQSGQPAQFDGQVRRAPLARQTSFDGAMDANVGIVNFVDGARTHWHQHTSDQILIVVHGECRFGDETGSGIAREGQVVRLPAGARHWHGAAPGGSMSHVTITRGGTTEWFEAVQD